LPGHEETVGVTAKDHRLFVEAVLYRYRVGIPWRDLPNRFGDFRVIHRHHTRWSQGGVWKRVFECLADDPDNAYAMSIPRSSAPTSPVLGQKGGPDGGMYRALNSGLTTKSHGLPSDPGQAHDLEGADALRPGMTADTLIADQGCDADEWGIESLRNHDPTKIQQKGPPGLLC